MFDTYCVDPQLTLSFSSTKIQQDISFDVVLYIAKEQGHIKFIKNH